MIMVVVIINCTQQSDVVLTIVHGSYGENLAAKISSIFREIFRGFLPFFQAKSEN